MREHIDNGEAFLQGKARHEISGQIKVPSTQRQFNLESEAFKYSALSYLKFSDLD